MRLVKAKQAGIRFVQVDRAVNVRLHNFVWDRMVDRIQTIQQQSSSQILPDEHHSFRPLPRTAA